MYGLLTSMLSKYLEFIRTMRSEYSKEEMQYESPHYLLILADQKLAERSETIKLVPGCATKTVLIAGKL